MPHHLLKILMLLAAESAELYFGQLLLDTAAHYKTQKEHTKLEAWLKTQS